MFLMFTDIKSASNIVFCNGALDPWRDGGVLRSPKPGSLDAYLIADGAHHLDLRYLKIHSLKLFIESMQNL